MSAPPQYLLDNRSDPDVRAVLHDWHECQGEHIPRTICALSIIAAAAAAAADAAAADDAAADDADDADDEDAGEAAAAAADDDDEDAGEADAAAVDDAASVVVDVGGGTKSIHCLREEPDMRNGLKIFTVPGRYGYSVTIIGWIRRHAGDEFDLLPGARTIVRTSTPRSLASLAAEGPKEDHKLSAPSKGIEEVNRLLVRRSLVADVNAWAEYCPRPANWSDE